MCAAVIAHTPRPYLRVTAGRKTAFLLTFSNTKKMINLIDSIVQSHRREVAASLKAGAGAFDEWDEKQVKTIFDYLFYNPGIPMSWGCEGFAAVHHCGRIGLKFHVSGFKFTGIIIVCYNEGRDYYEIWKQPEGSNGNGERFAEDVCFADLVAFIDAEVETDNPDGEEYQAKASKAAADAFNGLFNA